MRNKRIEKEQKRKQSELENLKEKGIIIGRQQQSKQDGSMQISKLELMTKEEMMIAFAQRKKEWIGMNRKYNTATPTIVPRRTQRHRVFFPDETYNLLMSELAQLDKEREEKIRSYSQRINPLAEQRRALIDIIDEDAEIQQNEHLAAIEEEKRLRLELIDKTKEYLSNRLTFMIRQRELIEEREFYRTETVCLQEDLSALLNQNKTTAPQRKQQYNEQLLLHLEHLRLMTSAIEEKTRDMLFWHEKRTVPMWKKKIRSVDARVKQWKKKEKEIRRRWKNDRVGLDTEAKRIQRRIQQLIMRDGKISESESDDDDNDDGQTYSSMSENERIHFVGKKTDSDEDRIRRIKQHNRGRKYRSKSNSQSNSNSNSRSQSQSKHKVTDISSIKSRSRSKSNSKSRSQSNSKSNSRSQSGSRSKSKSQNQSNQDSNNTDE